MARFQRVSDGGRISTVPYPSLKKASPRLDGSTSVSLIQISGVDVVIIADVDIKVIRKEDLQRVWNIKILILQSAPDLED